MDKNLKINRLETHDRLQHLTKQKDDISQYCQSIINQRPFGDRPFYIFAHKREIGLDERFSLFTSGMYPDLRDVPTHRMIWQPRLTKPKAQTNSMLFKGYPGTDVVKIIWMIPERELWEQYKKGNMTQCEIVVDCIDKFQNDRASLEQPDQDDPRDEEINSTYTGISQEAKWKRNSKIK
jgi:hypothetical protein